MKLIRDVVPEIIAGLVVAVLVGVASYFIPVFRDFMFDPIETNLFVIGILILIACGISISITRFTLKRIYELFEQRHKEEIQLLNEKLEQSIDSSTRDTLTGAKNSNQILPLLNERIKEAKAKRQAFVLILVDIDGFKRINDTYNHEVGNYILWQFAREIEPRGKDEPLVRYGGDEFLIISKLGTDANSGYGFAERLRREVSQFEFLVKINSPQRERLTISCGVIEFILDKDDRKTLLERVAEALHIAKQPRMMDDGSVKSKNFVYVNQDT